MHLRAVVPVLAAALLAGGPAFADPLPIPEEVKTLVRDVVERYGEPEVPEPRDVVHGVLGEEGVETVRYLGRCVTYGEC